MKRKYLLAFALAGALTFGAAPITAYAASPNAGGTIVGEEQGDAGDTLEIGDEDTPLGTPEEGGQDNVQLEDEETPLGAVSPEIQTRNGFSWWGFVAGLVTMGVVETGGWAVFKALKKGKK